jgi:hypothetical protein
MSGGGCILHELFQRADYETMNAGTRPHVDGFTRLFHPLQRMPAMMLNLATFRSSHIDTLALHKSLSKHSFVSFRAVKGKQKHQSSSPRDSDWSRKSLSINRDARWAVKSTLVEAMLESESSLGCFTVTNALVCTIVVHT